MGDELGWRGRAIALAALGGAAMGRAAFAPQDPGAPSPLQMQVLAYLASHDAGDSQAGADEGGLAVALRIDQEIIGELLRTLAAKDLVAYRELALNHEDGDESEDADSEWSEGPATEEPRLALTALGWRQVTLWLHRIQPMFSGWPPDRPDVDDAVG